MKNLLQRDTREKDVLSRRDLEAEKDQIGASKKSRTIRKVSYTGEACGTDVADSLETKRFQ